MTVRTARRNGGRTRRNGRSVKQGRVPGALRSGVGSRLAVAAKKPRASAPSVSSRHSRHLVEVTTKHGLMDATGVSLLNQIPSLGIQSTREVRVSTLYEITGRLSPNQLQQVSRELLSDPITQEYRTEQAATSPAFLMGPHWRLEVWLKPTVTDPVGESVCKAVADLGLPEPASVRTGTAYHIIGRVNRSQVERILSKLLSNPVIHATKMEQK